MSDARVIPFDDGERRRSAAADAVAAGADRASNERARRKRGNPLVTGPTAGEGIAPTAGDKPPAPAPDGAAELELPEWERRVASALAFIRRRITGDVQVDEFGFDAELTEKVLLAGLRPLYEKYFRVEARGLENVPSAGGALVVANHSGTVPLDSVMTQIALLDHHPAHHRLQHLRQIGHGHPAEAQFGETHRSKKSALRQRVRKR